ncbi:MAG: HPF/RaiA family ribosome-associated protein [Dehalococcoidia bacterium]|nr:HPF/RaiA family ribosome-associated protein [Dehalococcoidia bacterium]
MQLEIRRGPLHLTREEEEYIHERGDFLMAFHPELIACRVSLDAPVNHHRKGGPFEVHIDLHLPGTIITVNRQKADDLHTAVRMAFEAARRQVEEHTRAQREQSRAS